MNIIRSGNIQGIKTLYSRLRLVFFCGCGILSVGGQRRRTSGLGRAVIGPLLFHSVIFFERGNI